MAVILGVSLVYRVSSRTADATEKPCLGKTKNQRTKQQQNKSKEGRKEERKEGRKKGRKEGRREKKERGSFQMNRKQRSEKEELRDRPALRSFSL
jgi:flagellar biosynthesis/type III secretory pathway protein FliH